MRNLAVFLSALCGLLLLANVGFAQTSPLAEDNIETSSASYSALPGPGMYAMPFVPLVSTPIAQLPNPPLQVGAGNATGENVTGAENATAAATPQSANPPLIEPRLSGATISSDIYPR